MVYYRLIIHFLIFFHFVSLTFQAKGLTEYIYGPYYFFDFDYVRECVTKKVPVDLVVYVINSSETPSDKMRFHNPKPNSPNTSFSSSRPSQGEFENQQNTLLVRPISFTSH